jgi:hypothetical protein
LQAPLDDARLATYAGDVVREPQAWGWIGAVEVLDPV